MVFVFVFVIFFCGTIKQYSNKCLQEQHHRMTSSAKQPQQQFTLKSKQQFKLKKKQNYHIQSIFKKPIYQRKGPQILSHARNQSL